MSLIVKQVESFYRSNFNNDNSYKLFISELRSHLYDYRKDSHKLEFLTSLIVIIKNDYDKHDIECDYNPKANCPTNIYFEDTLFFVQNEIDELLENMPTTEFNNIERVNINQSLEKILSDLDKVKMGQELTYNDFENEFKELKELYFLNKKTWSQLLIGKLSEMVAGGIIGESVSKDIVETVSKNFDGLIS